MLRALLLALLAVPIVSAQTAEVRQLTPPLSVVADTTSIMEGYPIVRYRAVGADSVAADILQETWREPNIIDHGGGWLEFGVSCGTECFFSIFVDKQRGLISPEVWYPLAFDPSRRLVVNVEDDVLRIGHPMRPALAFNVEIDFDPVVGRLLAAIEDVTLTEAGDFEVIYRGPGDRRQRRTIQYSAPR